jgi:hypothetical protein
MTTPLILSPPPLIFQEPESLTILIHAASKIGKSSTAATAPLPILVLDVEGSWKFIPARKRYWNPMNEAPPVYDGSWDVCVVNVHEWQTVPMVYRWITSYPTAFTTVCIDSVTELQRRCKQNLKGTEAMRIQDWGVLLSQMDATIRGFRDLTLMPGLPVRCCIFVAETRQGSDGKWKPFMQGQIEVALPYWVDIAGYLYPDYEVDPNGQATAEVRRLLIHPHPQYEAGERVQGRLGQVVTITKPPTGQVGTSIIDMMIALYGTRTEPTPQYAAALPRAQPAALTQYVA